MTALALALGAALGWGVADFVAGVTSRRATALVVLWLSQWLGFVIVAATAAVAGLETPRAEDLLFAVFAGFGLALGLGALYRAMVVGAMALAAPIAATGVMIPVVVGLASGDDPTAVQSIGLVAAIGGVMLCARDPAANGAIVGGVAAGVGLSLLAALGGGITATSLAAASSAGVLWVLFVQRAIVGALALSALLATGGLRLPARDAVPAIAAVGVIDLIATGLFTLATVEGELSLVAVVGGLYPVVTVMLAFSVLSERLAAHQTVGVVIALTGVAGISSGA